MEKLYHKIEIKSLYKIFMNNTIRIVSILLQ